MSRMIPLMAAAFGAMMTGTPSATETKNVTLETTVATSDTKNPMSAASDFCFSAWLEEVIQNRCTDCHNDSSGHNLHDCRVEVITSVCGQRPIDSRNGNPLDELPRCFVVCNDFSPVRRLPSLLLPCPLRTMSTLLRATSSTREGLAYL